MIRVEHLGKSFKRRLTPKHGVLGSVAALLKPNYETAQALQDISFDIPDGEIVGYVGMNGAGKSTTVKCLSGVLVPSAGAVEVAGIVPYKHRTVNARNVGVVFGQRTQLWWDVSPRATYELLRA